MQLDSLTVSVLMCTNAASSKVACSCDRTIPCGAEARESALGAADDSGATRAGIPNASSQNSQGEMQRKHHTEMQDLISSAVR